MSTFETPAPLRPRERHLVALDGGGQAPPPFELDLVLRAAAEQVGVARRAVARLAADAGLDALEIGAVELAVNEACANVVHHAYATAHPAPSMQVSGRADARALVVEVSDRGRGVQPRLARGVERRTLGLPIMISLCDRLAVMAPVAGPGTTVTMTFLL